MTVYLTDAGCPAPYMVFPQYLLDMKISETTKLVYMLLLDRARLSLKSDKWTDASGHTFLYYPVKSLAGALHKSEMTVKNSLAVLEQENLITRVRQGAGMPSRIYVKVPQERERKLSAQGTKNYLPEGKGTVPLTDRKLSTIKNKGYKTNYPQKEYRDYSCSEDESL